MKRLRNLMSAFVAGIRSGQVRVVVHELRRRLWSDWTHYGLSRDLDVPFAAPYAKIPLEIRTLRETDLPKLLGMNADYVPALKGCQRSGFSPYLIRVDSWRLLRRRVTFEPLPPGTPYPFEAAARS